MFHDTHAFPGFSVNDLGKAREFYEKTLGLDVIEEHDMLWLHIATGYDIFMYQKDTHVPATYTMLNFPVDDIDKAADALAQRGVTLIHYEGMTDDKGIARGVQMKKGPNIAWFSDPAGNILSIIEK